MNLRIANRLLEYRKANGYSQEELAERIGVSRQAVSKWERGEASPDTDNLIALAALYRVTIDEMINGSDEPQGAGNDNNEENTSEAADTADDGEPHDHVNIGWNGIHVEDKNGDKVHVSFKGIHVEDSSGEKVHIAPGDIHINADDGGTVIETKDGKIYVNGEEDECKHGLPVWFTSCFPLLTVIAYLVLGFTVPGYGWSCGWLVFFLIPLVYSLSSAIKHRKGSRFAYPVLAAGLYLAAGLIFSRWHPEWIIFITVPVYYSICEGIEHNRRKKRRK